MARKYEELAQVETELKNFATAVQFFTEALNYEPTREASLRGRAQAGEALGRSAKEQQDRRARPLAMSKVRQGDARRIENGTVGSPLDTDQHPHRTLHCDHNAMIINLDHNATTAIHPEVVQAMAECYLAGYGNAASSHQHGRRARQVLEDAREGIGRLVGADMTGVQADRIILTSGGTEANNLALLGMAGTEPGRIIISSVEHPSVTGPAEQLERRGFDVCRVRVDSSGVIDEAHFDELLTPAARLVSIMLANNETGVLQPIEPLAGRCRKIGVPFHTDAVQAVGKTPVHFAQLQVTALTLTGHKFHGPRGIGALLIERSWPHQPDRVRRLSTDGAATRHRTYRTGRRFASCAANLAA